MSNGKSKIFSGRALVIHLEQITLFLITGRQNKKLESEHFEQARNILYVGKIWSGRKKVKIYKKNKFLVYILYLDAKIRKVSKFKTNCKLLEYVRKIPQKPTPKNYVNAFKFIQCHMFLFWTKSQQKLFQVCFHCKGFGDKTVNITWFAKHVVLTIDYWSY